MKGDVSKASKVFHRAEPTGAAAQQERGVDDWFKSVGSDIKSVF